MTARYLLLTCALVLLTDSAREAVAIVLAVWTLAQVAAGAVTKTKARLAAYLAALAASITATVVTARAAARGRT